SFDAPTPDPCGTCSSCERIRNGIAIDVVEMDAASETGIDDVREKIIENARYAPAESRFKVYIIDEVHDLSAKAFDSLLKTIEEPPAHVVFVLATTEAHKVPMTIRSRCQRLDFRRGATADLTANLKRVLEAEGRTYDAEAVFLVARAAEGSFRDSLSLLEQVMAFTDGSISAEAVQQAIGAVTTDLLDSALDAASSGEMRAVFEAGQRMVASGADVRQVLTALQSHIRDLIVVSFAGSAGAIEGIPDERLATLRAQSARFTSRQLVAMLGVLAEAERDVRFTNQHRLVLERALWRMLPQPEAAPGPQPPRKPAPATPVRRQPEPPPRPAAPQPVAPEPAARPEPTVPEPAIPEPVEDDSEPFATEVDLAVLRRLWPRVRARLLQKSKAAASIFGAEEVVALDGMIVSVAFGNEFARSHADRPRARQMVDEVLADVLRVPGYAIRCVLAQADTPEAAPQRPEPASEDNALLGKVLLEFPAAVVQDRDK
ncbi:MAG: DNA polymerase III subunit gamma/tau, partial [Armatimonadetes bacterium]|nr:DNA polymerase III subunit gamma/tau [Armatimonadota bacterium]